MAEDPLLIVTPTGANIVGLISSTNKMAQEIAENVLGEFEWIVRRLTRDDAAKAVLSVFCEL
jgi:hypothetical protein